MFVGSTVKATDSGALNREFEYGRKAIITFVFFYSWTNRWHYRRGHYWLFAGYRGSSNSISSSV